MAKKPKACLIGLGARGEFMLKNVFVLMIKQGLLDIVSVCDTYDDRMQMAADVIQEASGNRPLCSSDYKTALGADVNCCMILSAWESHVEIALYCMERGIKVGTEVGGAYNIGDCYRLVDAYERTGIQCMMLENCCYGRRELMVLNMVKKDFLGKIVHCSGGYQHDLRYEIADGKENRHYRLRNYLNRCCENYPTHELGPIMSVLDINHGNRLLTLTSTASCSAGMNEYLTAKNSYLKDRHFNQGDIVTTVIKCAGGETVVLTLDTTLPRVYSRGFTVRGTKGMYNQDADYVYIEGKPEDPITTLAGNAKEYEEEFEHPIWQEYHKDPIGGHDGMDWLVYNAFLDYVSNDSYPPIDTYDTATMMSISVLSEQSIATGGMPQAIPDFTSGKWITRTETPVVSKNPYTLR